MSRRGWGCELARLGCEPARLGGVSRRKSYSLPFRLFPVIWVEISNRLHWDSLPFSAVSRYLGRDFQQASSGFSTFSPVSRYLGRDFQPAEIGFSTHSTDFRCLDRDFQPAALGFLSTNRATPCFKTSIWVFR